MKRIVVAFAAGLFAAVLCGAQNSTAVDLSNYHQEGIASWYGVEFDGRPTASGEIFNSSLYTAAHPTLPFGTQLTVTNLNNGRRVNVRVNDRGPFVSSRIIDLSQAAAQMLDMVSSGTAPVRVEIMGNVLGNAQGDSGTYQAETNAGAVSQGGYASATSQIVAPYPVFQNPTYQAPQTPQAPVQTGEQVVVQVQPPQQQITQYFQQPVQPIQPAAPQQVQQQPPQQPIRQQPVQPIQQILPVQQVIQPIQPIVQPITQAPAQPVAPTPVQPVQVQEAPVNQPQVSPVQIHIPIEVKPIVSSEPIIIPTPRAPEPAAPAPAAPPAAAAPTVKPNMIYRVQVGSFREARNALAAFDRLKGAGLNPVYERNGDYFRVVLSGIPSDEVNGVLQKIRTAGFADPLLREER